MGRSYGLAALIDPALPCTIVAQFIQTKGLDLRYLLLTHTHGDHICGLPWFKKRFPEARIAVHCEGADLILEPDR